MSKTKQYIEDIQEWLASEVKDYQAGIQLLALQCKNRVLLQNLQKKENAWGKEKLEYELRKLVPKVEVEQPEQPLSIEELRTLVQNGKELLQTLPVESEDYKRQLGLQALYEDELALLEEQLSQAEQTPPAEDPTEAEEEDGLEKHLEIVHELGSIDYAKLSDVDQLVKLRSETYVERARLSNRLVELGESNEPALVQERQLIIEQIEICTTRYNSIKAQISAIETAGGELAQKVEKADSFDVVKADMLSLVQKRQNTRSNVTKWNKKLVTLVKGTPDANELESKVKNGINLIDAISKEIKSRAANA